MPVELERLALSFNHMLERIEDVFTRQSNFSADIAHEIRTPITNLVTQTEIALSQSRSPQELEEVLYPISKSSRGCRGWLAICCSSLRRIITS